MRKVLKFFVELLKDEVLRNNLVFMRILSFQQNTQKVYSIRQARANWGQRSIII